MSAKDMFEELGYNINIEYDYIYYKNQEENCYIYFYDYQAIELRCDDSLDVSVYKAINQQCKELGWIE